MKKVVCLAAIIVCGYGCSKEAVNLQEGVFGTWELRKSSGTIAGYIHLYKPGNGNTITFLDSSRYRNSYVGDDTSFSGSGTYKLTKGAGCLGNEVVFLSCPPNEYNSILSISNDTLFINDNCIADGVYSTYVKIR